MGGGAVQAGVGGGAVRSLIYEDNFELAASNFMSREDKIWAIFFTSISKFKKQLLVKGVGVNYEISIFSQINKG